MIAIGTSGARGIVFLTRGGLSFLFFLSDPDLRSPDGALLPNLSLWALPITELRVFPIRLPIWLEDNFPFGHSALRISSCQSDHSAGIGSDFNFKARSLIALAET